MKKDPCVRLGIRMSPKISEKPADRRNRSPPSVTLLIASTSHRFMKPQTRWWSMPPEERALRSGERRGSALQRRIVPRVDGLREKPLLVVGPELTHVLVGLDRRVDELVALLVAPPDVEVPDHVAEVVEAERPARRIGERDAAERLDEHVLVLGLSARLL